MKLVLHFFIALTALISSIQMMAQPPVFSADCPTSSESPDADLPLKPKDSNEKICPSLDMRGHVTNLSALEGCTVVEGVVHIVDIKETDDHFLNQTFPLLREITGYLLVYRVEGLRSIGQLFPNLTVIRGTQLFFNCSLVIYKNMQLQEIGLKSLTDLQYGSVMIERNPNFCHVKTIEWGGRIGPSGRRDDRIENNKGICPKCPYRCPADNGNRLCWSNDHYQQKVCHGCSGACNITHPPKQNNYCCHEECAGGCTGQERNQCRVCKHVLHRNHCYSECPPFYFQHLKRRCLTDSECTSLPPPRDRCDATWKAFKDECILDCPSGYQEVRVRKNNGFSKSVCEPCTEYYSTENAVEISRIVIDDSNFTTGSVKIGWDKQVSWIANYQFEFKRTDFTNAELKRACVGRKDLIETSRTDAVLSDLSPGNYCVQVRAVSPTGTGPFSKETCFFIKEHIPSSVGVGMIAEVIISIVFLVAFGAYWAFWLLLGILAAGVIIFILFLVAFGVGAYNYTKIKRRINIDSCSMNPDHVSIEVRQDPWEISRGNVQIGRELNRGSYGIVYKGYLKTDAHKGPCAIKTINKNASKEEKDQLLIYEASVMKEFNAHHVVKLLGVVSKAQPTLVVMALMANEDLKTYLRSHRPDCETNVSEGRQPPTLKCILKMAIEIADGMAYLAEKKFVHRDLAARNCMVAEDLTVKIGDFGMTRKISKKGFYQQFFGEYHSVRWMPPESLKTFGICSECSDVWSYGVVLWEIATLASEPYQGLSNDQVLKYVMDGGVMKRPEGCPDRLYVLMEMCWRYQAKHRPSFLDIIEDLLPEVPPHFESVSFYHSDLGVAARAALKAHFEQETAETRSSNDPSTPLQEQLDESELEVIAGGCNSNIRHYLRQQHHLPSGKQILQMNDNRNGERDPVASGTEEGDDEEDETRAHADDRDEADNGEEDHLLVLHPNERQVYILVRNPAGNSTSNSNSGSRGDCSKGDNSAVSTVPSDDCKE